MTDLAALNMRQTASYQADTIASLQARLRLLETQELGASPSAIETIQDTAGAMLTDSSSVDFTYDDGAATITAVVKASGIVTTMITDLNVTTGKLADAAVTSAKLANMAEATVKGRAVGAGTGVPVDLSAAQLNAIWGAADAFNPSNVVTLGVGSDEGRGQMGTTPFKVKGQTMLFYRESADSQSANMEFLKRRSGTGTVLQNGDGIGSIVFTGADTTTFGAVAARINAFVDGTPGSADMPGRLVFLTSPDGTATPTESFRVDASQNLIVADGKRIETDEVRARDSGGLYLRDDGGNLGLFVEDGGQVGVGTDNPTVTFDVVGGVITAPISRFTGTNSAGDISIEFYNDANADTANAVNFISYLKSTTQKRFVFNINATFSTTTDASRTSLIKFNTLNSGSTATPLTLAGGLVGISNIAPSAALLQVGAGSSTTLDGIQINMPASTSGDALETQYNTTTYLRFTAFSNLNQINMVSVDLGNNVAGPNFLLGRNASGGAVGPSPGAIRWIAADAGTRWTWLSNSSVIRFHTAAPTGSTGAPTVDQTAGSVLGDQTSWHEAKNIGEQVTDTKAALKRILDLAVHEFQYKTQDYLDKSGKNQTFTGLVGYDRDDWFLKNCGPQQVPALNEISVIGQMVLAIQELAGQFDQLLNQ